MNEDQTAETLQNNALLILAMDRALRDFFRISTGLAANLEAQVPQWRERPEIYDENVVHFLNEFERLRSDWGMNIQPQPSVTIRA
jgi:hypothetical protein